MAINQQNEMGCEMFLRLVITITNWQTLILCINSSQNEYSNEAVHTEGFAKRDDVCLLDTAVGFVERVCGDDDDCFCC